MADPSHLAVARQGSAAISEWRSKHPGVVLDLTEAALEGIDLTDADLRDTSLMSAFFDHTHLDGANLDGVSLSAAYIGHSTLVGANLRNTLLAETQFDHSDMTGANLESADLTDARLEGVSLYRTGLNNAHLQYTLFLTSELTDTNFEDAIIDSTMFIGCDLSRCLGLESVDHRGFASLSIETLERTFRGSGGLLTSVLRDFFLEAGVPETLLDYLPSLLEASPLQFYKCFLSYAAADEPFPEKLYQDLLAGGVSVWKFDQSAVVGRGLWANIDRAIQSYDKVILICSEQSLQSPAVLREMERALQKEDRLRKLKTDNPEIDADVLFPVRLDNYVLTDWKHERRDDLVSKVMSDFRECDSNGEKYERELSRLVKALDPRSWST